MVVGTRHRAATCAQRGPLWRGELRDLPKKSNGAGRSVVGNCLLLAGLADAGDRVGFSAAPVGGSAVLGAHDAARTVDGAGSAAAGAGTSAGGFSVRAAGGVASAGVALDEVAHRAPHLEFSHGRRRGVGAARNYDLDLAYSGAVPGNAR